ncbi:biopolymer transporter ExbD [Lusitaniella coriacea LEGE 07157]|uniref:Biopolymer transporter ExbD n=1 Tax=Lusitaniella coriacea LEGE 07157 TaxID=945747 RepID=A0A8J7DXH1_9CYAN|nr:biopolymer transporter ExbD [Lusitaniella coriacea]MBE9117144.1 biopolymer transporter ExbD [Lusitaniella coriacea LEGE 07157]
MRFRNRQTSSVPEVNLVPMMDVLMSVLTFFIITSMTLTGQRLGNINLPNAGSGGGAIQEKVQPLVVGLDKEGAILIDNQAISEAELAEEMQAYLAEKPDGKIVVKADRVLAYKDITQLLKKMAAIGGDRVSLAIQK